MVRVAMKYGSDVAETAKLMTVPSSASWLVHTARLSSGQISRPVLYVGLGAYKMLEEKRVQLSFSGPHTESVVQLL